jgi:hypothetical protein
MRFHFGQYVTRKALGAEQGIGILGRIIRVKRRTIKDSAGSRYSVRVYWPNGYVGVLSGAQLRVVCPTCAELTWDFSKEQCERQKKECDICNQRTTT